MLPIHLAPLQGITDHLYRNALAHIHCGIDQYYTPFIRVERGTYRERDLRQIAPNITKVSTLVPQIIAGTPEELHYLIAQVAPLGYRQFDLNLGCPFPMQAKKQRGSGILPFPEKVHALLESTTHYPNYQFSVKMRLGWSNPEECLALLPMLAHYPLTHLCMHPRIGTQQYQGDLDMRVFQLFYEACPLPLIYNGDITSVAKAREVEERFPALVGLMIGRGIIANPLLAAEIKGETFTVQERKQKLLQLHTAVLEANREQMRGGDEQVLAKMQGYWDYFCPEGDKKLRKKIKKSSSLTKYEQLAHELLNQLA